MGIGSICGGGRYDDLTGIFGLKGMSGVGISFGADRIYDVLEELDLFPADATRSTELLYINFGAAEQGKCLDCSPISGSAAVAAMLAGSPFVNSERESVSRLMDNLGNLVKSVPTFRLSSRMEDSFGAIMDTVTDHLA